MAGLIGLSPEEISAISGRRTATESDRYKMAGMLVNMMGANQQGELARRKLELLENPPMVKMKIADQIYEIPKGSQIEGAKAKAEVEERLRTGRISQAEHDAWMRPVVTSLPRGDEGWVDYEVPSGMLESMASGIKSLQDVRVSGVEEERKRKGVAALGGQTIGDIEDIPLSTLAATIPGALPALVSRPRPEVPGLKPEERRKLIQDHAVRAEKLLSKDPKQAAISEASISAYNEQSTKLNYPSMMFYYEKITPYFSGGPDISEPIEVQLPIVGGKQVTPNQIQEAATKRGISVNNILRTIYEGQLTIESSKR